MFEQFIDCDELTQKRIDEFDSYVYDTIPVMHITWGGDLTWDEMVDSFMLATANIQTVEGFNYRQRITDILMSAEKIGII